MPHADTPSPKSDGGRGTFPCQKVCSPRWPRKLAHGRTAYLKTEVKDRMQELRRRLPAEDQQILILRVSRKLSWTELAIVLGDSGLTATDVELQREATRLRKRFQLAKDRLRELARQEGLTE